MKQILISEVSLPAIEVPIELLLPVNNREIGKDKPSIRRCEGAFVQRKFGFMSSVSVRFLHALCKSQVKASVCVPGSRACVRYVHAFQNLIV